MEEAYAGDEAEDMANLATEIKEIEKQTKVVERSIPTREKKLATINKKIAQKKKALGTWNDKNREKQEQLAKSAETKSLVNSEELALQQELEREQLALESIMQENAVRAMEAEDVLSSCASMEANIRQVNERLGIMKRDITAAETSVKNRVDEIRDKFLSDFVVSDADILIELLDKEVQVWSKKDTDEFDTFEATFSDKAETVVYWISHIVCT
ncbi:hypothetical protein PHYBOEH_004400 [Phytophthora boehmeriae]|uniref:Uncharacterized protein n=1 Tax=Phytophthora boehmeriae TaxID=109152 RepID=A0A8T1WRN6_9STRA|nr:hypothetical protein PHYBOEH_004400 [Phytophthora boehmeriae]